MKLKETIKRQYEGVKTNVTDFINIHGETVFGMGVLGLIGGLAAYCCGYKRGKNGIDPALTELWDRLDKDVTYELWRWTADQHDFDHDSYLIAAESDVKKIVNDEMK